MGQDFVKELFVIVTYASSSHNMIPYKSHVARVKERVGGVLINEQNFIGMHTPILYTLSSQYDSIITLFESQGMAGWAELGRVLLKEQYIVIPLLSHSYVYPSLLTIQ